MTIIESMLALELFGRFFAGASWAPWRAFLAALFGLPLSDAELALFQHCTGRQRPPTQAAREAWLVSGRRSGKSRIAALVGVYLACVRTYVLAPGERGLVMILAADRRQARIIRRYVGGLLHGVPMLERLIAHETRDAIDLTTNITVEIHTSSFRAVRGYTVVACLADEIGFWNVDADAADPDVEVLHAIRPAMSTIENALLLCLSTPYGKRGQLWEAYSAHFGAGHDADPIFVWQSDTRTMNGTVAEAVIEAAYLEDDAVAASEYGGQFRADLERFVSREVLESAVVAGRAVLPPIPGVTYAGFCDPSGGMADSMSLAVSHKQGDTAILDVIVEVRPPFSPESVVAQFAQLLHEYRIDHICADRYAGQWPTAAFRKHGITVQPAALTKSDLYAELLPLLNSGRVELLDQKRLVAQIASLERRTTRSGKDAIDARGHEDLANACAGSLLLAASPRVTYFSEANFVADADC